MACRLELSKFTLLVDTKCLSLRETKWGSRDFVKEFKGALLHTGMRQKIVYIGHANTRKTALMQMLIYLGKPS